MKRAAVWRRFALALLMGGLLMCGPGALAANAGVGGVRCENPTFANAKPAPAGSVALVLSHGWTGSTSGMHDLADSLRNELKGVSVYLFDYGRDSDRWPSDPRIAACLGAFIHNISDQNSVPVVYAAHSMGGLAIRFAADPKYAGSAAVTTKQLAEVVTIDTPHLGSPWGGTKPAQVLQVVQMLTTHGGLPGQGRAADKCLSETRPCDLPPYLPAGTSMHMVSGETSIKRTAFGVELYRIPMRGDGIVLDGSMSGYLTSGPRGVTRPVGRVGFTTASCLDDSGAMTTALSKLTPPVPAPIVSHWVRAFTDMSAWDDINDGKLTLGSGTLWGVATLTAKCSHLSIMDQPETRATIIAAVERAKTAQSAPKMSETQLRNALIPAGSCAIDERGWPGEQPVQMRDGQGWAADPDSEGAWGVSILELSLLGRADVNGDGADETVLMMLCSGTPPELCCAGQTSVAWTIGVFKEESGRLVRVADPYLGGLTYPGDEYGPLTRGISEATLEGATLVTQEHIHYSLSYTPEQAGGDPTRPFMLRLQLRGSHWAEQ